MGLALLKTKKNLIQFLQRRLFRLQSHHICVSQKGDQLWVKEEDVLKNSVRCLCPYNLKYEIPLRHGTYTIRINDGAAYTFTHHAATDTVIFLGLSMKNDLSF